MTYSPGANLLAELALLEDVVALHAGQRPQRVADPHHGLLLHAVEHRHLGETGPLSQGVQARRKALRIRYINSMEVRKKRPRGFKKRPRGFK